MKDYIDNHKTRLVRLNEKTVEDLHRLEAQLSTVREPGELLALVEAFRSSTVIRFELLRTGEPLAHLDKDLFARFSDNALVPDLDSIPVVREARLEAF